MSMGQNVNGAGRCRDYGSMLGQGSDGGTRGRRLDQGPVPGCTD
ncbi:MAG TPA: hypothetical protein VHD83_27170 [Puia sp.]|nr:hypothetical protein [Puia sp.]